MTDRPLSCCVISGLNGRSAVARAAHQPGEIRGRAIVAMTDQDIGAEVIVFILDFQAAEPERHGAVPRGLLTADGSGCSADQQRHQRSKAILTGSYDVAFVPSCVSELAVKVVIVPLAPSEGRTPRIWSASRVVQVD